MCPIWSASIFCDSYKVDVNEAGKHLRELIDKAARGRDVIITCEDGAAFKLVPAPEAKSRPRFGSAKGEVWMSDDFDEPLDVFKDYMPSQ
jgi:antitoxin (DNA-binding transcriptional repressor) of toxin-antitoxin stability system